MEQNSTDRVALIDFDSVFYIVGHTHRDADHKSPADAHAVRMSVDSILDMILTMTHSTQYLIAISATDEVDFRKQQYKYAEYKGNRGTKPEFIEKWKPVIEVHVKTEWSITSYPGFEADDVIATAANTLRNSNIDYVVCSPDKDLQQIEGYHWNYSKAETQEMIHISQEKANYNKWMQVLTGDATDNIAGIPGLGPVKAALVLKDTHQVEYRYKVEQAYIKYFGTHYGPIIMRQTFDAISLVTNCKYVMEFKNYTPKHERELF